MFQAMVEWLDCYAQGGALMMRRNSSSEHCHHFLKTSALLTRRQPPIGASRREGRKNTLRPKVDLQQPQAPQPCLITAPVDVKANAMD